MLIKRIQCITYTKCMSNFFQLRQATIHYISNRTFSLTFNQNLMVYYIPCARSVTEPVNTCCTWHSGKIGPDRRPYISRNRHSDTDSCLRHRTNCTPGMYICRSDSDNFCKWLVQADECHIEHI